MLAAIHQLNTKENLVKVKMEEQTVPSAGFSPQPDLYDQEYKFVPHQQHVYQTPSSNNYGPTIITSQQSNNNNNNNNNNGTLDDSSNYGNLADAFDLSLLGDTYDDNDMATVPSPSWSPAAHLELSNWQQMSLYATSPSRDFRAFSPDLCMKPALSPVPAPVQSQLSPYPSDNSYLQINSPATPGSVHGGNSGSSSPVHQVQHQFSLQQQQQQQQPQMGQLGVGLDRHLLLRQYLEDTSFQQKYNFKPLDLPTASFMGDLNIEAGSDHEMGRSTPSSSSSSTSSSTSSENVGNALELNQIDPVFNMAFEQFRSDIQNVCTILAISPDPMAWSGQDVQSWLAHTLHSFTNSSGGGMMGGASTNNNSSALQQFWNLDGRSLCSLEENEFRLRDPVSGDRLFSTLELWKTLQNQSQSNNQNQRSFQSIPQQQQQRQQADVSVNFPVNINVNVNCNLNSTNNNANNNVFNLEQLLMSPSLASPHSISSSATPCDSHNLTSNVPDILVNNSSSNNKNTSTTSSSSQQQQQSGSAFISTPSTVDSAVTSPSSSSPSFPSPLGTEPMNTDDDDEEEEEEEEKKPAVGKTKGTSPNVPKSGAHIHLWQFLKELLASPQQHGSCIRWLDQSRGVFKIEDSVRVARLWGLRKNRPAMNYDKLSRSIRQYYRKGIMRKTERSQRLVYQFCHPYGL